MKEMSITDHLEELRKVAISIVIILIFSFFITYSFGEEISEILLISLRDSLIDSEVGEIVYFGLFDKILSKFQIAFWSAIIMASPLWFWQLWKFVKPGLYEKEIKIIRPFIIVGFILFCLGVLFGYFLVFPYGLKMLMEFGAQNITAQISLKEYLLFTLKVLVFLGLMFQLPNLLLILGLMGLVSKHSLSSMRRYIYVIFAVIAASVTPPDVITMIAIWIPLIILYEIGIWGVHLIATPKLSNLN